MGVRGYNMSGDDKVVVCTVDEEGVVVEFTTTVKECIDVVNDYDYVVCVRRLEDGKEVLGYS